MIAEGSIQNVLTGKMYNRGVRVHKCIYEALMRLAWKQFAQWVNEVHPNKLPAVRVWKNKWNLEMISLNEHTMQFYKALVLEKFIDCGMRC